MGDNVQDLRMKKSKIMSNMVLLLLGRLVSLFGTRIYSFAISLYVLKTTGSGTTFALSLVFGTLPAVIFGPIAGVISDKINRKRIVVVMDILSGIVVLLLFSVAIIDDLRLSYIYITSFLLSTCNTFFNVPFQVSIPNIVDEKNLMRANSLNQAINSITSIAGPFLGGLVYAFIDIKLFLIINGISFIASGITEMFIDFNLNKPELNEQTLEAENIEVGKNSIIENFLRDFIEGFSYLKSTRSMFMLFISAIFINFFMTLGITVPFPYMVNEILKMSSKQFGVLEAIFPLGMLAGSIALSVMPQSEKNFKKIIFGLLVTNAGIILMGVSVVPELLIFSKNTYFIGYIIVSFIISIAIVVINIPIEVTLQREIPDNIRGRIFGLISTIAMSCTPIGMILSGVLIDLIPVWILPVLSGLVLLGLTVTMANNKDIREL